ncbi:protein FAM32A-like isoform X1 [Punica granatum]|uniref:Protein FAM32A-like isoform X1 n=1 Tax=Punica granatum TaxID=22663 RepID=A0A6P8BWB5_PUNGR|nr:protein FAM32A-like isoform X1 [Punica granatum]
MTAGYENVVVGKLKLKGKPLDVKGGGGVIGGGVSKKKKKKPKDHHLLSQSFTGGTGLVSSGNNANVNETETDGGRVSHSTFEDRLTPAERRFLQQREKIELERLARMANKSHRDRIQEFNQYLANLSEHYDIPKVGPG